MGQQENIEIFDRESGELCSETVFGGAAVRFIYQTLLGRTLWGILFNKSGISALLGKYYDSRYSAGSIAKLAATPGCNADEADSPLDSYNSFNAFFARKLKAGARPFDTAPELLSSPADGRIFVYRDLSGSDPIPVKGAKRTLSELCGCDMPENRYAVAVIRLAPVDYHRYHFPCSCFQVAEDRRIAGKYHSVNPAAVARRPDIYVENARNISSLKSDLFGKFFYIEVGAFGVGSIITTASSGKHSKMDEKGYFKFGGSTVIIVFENDKVNWSADLLDNTAKGYETLIRCGSTIGSAAVEK